ncbi:response regulator transcription factor [Marinobacterium arenosum]|uniref:response regulator transcription factor n=1 Tax=Marinobacterium arenosum TaxID=2862496 RepID=UPI001C9419CA|nr:winged helix-turn-helix domain-containing protein [Marinobacterium arenosum]MBY4678251.1 winged helix-turn-helix domain-containing protein [Marinobacterium arenosum]
MMRALDERLLIVEPDSRQVARLQKILLDNGFYVIGSCADGEEALQICEQLSPTLILLSDALAEPLVVVELAGQLLRQFNLPVVFLSDTEARGSAAMEALAAGFVSRPVREQDLVRSLRLAARLHRREQQLQAENLALRSSGNGRQQPSIQLSQDASYHLYSGTLLRAGRTIRLTPKEQKFLDLLCRHQGAVVAFEQIFVEVWDCEAGNFQSLRILVHRLRRKLGAQDAIENIFEMGYRLNLMGS